MKILIRQFLGKNHSWSICGWGIATSLVIAGHDVHLFATDGIEHLPAHLKPYVIGYCLEGKPAQITGRKPDASYDAQISYTQMRNFPAYLSSGNKNRIGIWCWEWKNAFPLGYMRHYKSCDMMVPPSSFAKEVFVEAKIPEASITVIPHGVNAVEYANTTTVELPTKKTYKILANIAQNHLRKNIPGLLDAYGKAFTKTDDVCLILKARPKAVIAPIEISLEKCINEFKAKYPEHAELKLFPTFVDDMSALYRSIDAVYTMAHSEAFYFPGLEGLCSGKINLSPRYGGQLDFLDDDNSLLIDGKEDRADPRSVYFYQPGEVPKSAAIWFAPSVDDAVDKLRYSYNHFEDLNAKIAQLAPSIREQYSWDATTKRILTLCNQ